MILFRPTKQLFKCMSPFLTCFPLLPYGRALRAGQLDAIDFVAIAIPSLRSLRRAHVSRRRLIMPLVALVQKNHSAPATSYSRLVLGTRFGRRRSSSNSVFEKVSANLF